jgi:hypothetical protein
MMKFVVFLFTFIFCFNLFAQTLEDVISIKVIDHGLPPLTKAWKASDLEEYFNSNFVTGDIPNHEKVYQIEKVASLPNGAQVAFKPVLEGDKTYVRIAMTADAFSDPVAVGLAGRYARSLNGTIFASTHSWIEAVTNARMQSKTAMWSLAELKLSTLNDPDEMFGYVDRELLGEQCDLDKFNKYLNESVSPSLKNEFKQIEVAAKNAMKEQKAKYEARKVIFDELDKSSDQLKDLIAKNDRKGVAKLIETYLPWEHMEPVEVKYWKDWLETVRNPLPLEKRTFVLRGLDNGQAFFNDANKAFLMPPVIINNQGTYNRRLRSLTTMLDKNISLNPNHEYLDNPKSMKKISRSSRLTNQLLNHSQDPMGSPHISFTKSSSVANQFSGNGKVAVFAIDPRLITPNLMSGFEHEIELIASMVVFPDENIGLISELDKVDYPDRVNHVDQELKKILESNFGAAKAKTIYAKEFGELNKLSTRESFQIESRKIFFERLDGISASNCSVHISP